MNIQEACEHALFLSCAYNFLKLDLAEIRPNHDVDEHNLCSAVVECYGQDPITVLSYSNPSGLPVSINDFYEFVIGRVPNPVIVRGGMQDLHTEVRILNQLYDQGYLTPDSGVNVITFFSSRTCCPTCRDAINTVQNQFSRKVALNAIEFKAEYHGTVTEYMYPINVRDPRSVEWGIAYEYCNDY